MNELNQRQHKFLKALLTTATVEEASQQASITRKTAYKYLNDPIFKEAYRDARRDAMQQVTTTLQATSVKAVHTLAEVLDDKDATASAKVQASRSILEFAYRAIELDDITARLEELETTITN